MRWQWWKRCCRCLSWVIPSLSVEVAQRHCSSSHQGAKVRGVPTHMWSTPHKRLFFFNAISLWISIKLTSSYQKCLCDWGYDIQLKCFFFFYMFFKCPVWHVSVFVGSKCQVSTNLLLILFSDLQDFVHNGRHIPRHHVVLCFGDEYPDPQRPRKLITAQVNAKQKKTLPWKQKQRRF